MNPAAIALVISLVEEAIKVSPQLIADFQTLFSKPNPTPEDWLALKAKVQATSFESLAPDVKTA